MVHEEVRLEADGDMRRLIQGIKARGAAGCMRANVSMCAECGGAACRGLLARRVPACQRLIAETLSAACPSIVPCRTC